MIIYIAHTLTTDEQMYYLIEINKVLVDLKKFYSLVKKDKYILEYYDLKQISEKVLQERTDYLCSKKLVTIYLRTLITSIDSVAFIVYEDTSFRSIYELGSDTYLMNPKHYYDMIKDSNSRKSIITRIAYYYHIKCIQFTDLDYPLMTQSVFNIICNQDINVESLSRELVVIPSKKIVGDRLIDIVHKINKYVVSIKKYHNSVESDLYVLEYYKYSTISKEYINNRMSKLNASYVTIKYIDSKIDTLFIIYRNNKPVKMNSNIYLINPIHFDDIIDDNITAILLRYAYAYYVYGMNINKLSPINITKYIKLFIANRFS